MNAENHREAVKNLKIHEVEQAVGITVKNIRFYEEQGLLSPRRGLNGYRDYGEEEVEILRRIKLLRKIGLPIEEIRQMQSGVHTVADGMRRHLITLEREQRSLEQSMELCRRLKDREERIDTLDAAALLEEMERLEKTGTTFENRQKGDAKPVRYVGAVVMAVLICALMLGLIFLMIWGYSTAPEDAPPLPLMAVLAALPVVVVLGVLLALFQRIKEIQKGEEDDAKRY